MASTYYDSAGKEVTDGDIAFAADLNDINIAVDTALQQVETDILAVAANQSYYAELAEKWAIELEDVAVTPGKYSAFHWANKSEDQAILADADRVQTGLDRTQTGLDKVATAADRIQTGSDRTQTGLDRVATGQDKITTAADRVQTGLDRTAASDSADAAAASVAELPTLVLADQGKYLQVATPFTDGYIITDLSSKADLASPTFTGTPAAPTASVGTNTTQLATTAFVAANQSKLPAVSGLNTTGSVRGFDVVRKSNTQITVTKGSCKDSTDSVDLALTANVDVTVVSGNNTASFLFVCRLVSNSSITVRAYASEAAAAADTGTINAFRFIGWSINNGSGNVSQIGMTDGWFSYLKASDGLFSSTFSSVSYTALDFSSRVPLDRISTIEFGISAVGADGATLYLSLDGTNTASWIGGRNTMTDTTEGWGVSTLGFSNSILPYLGTIYGKSTVGTINISVHSFKLRR